MNEAQDPFRKIRPDADASNENQDAAESAENSSLEDQLEATRAERDEQRDLALRAHAEMENVRKRAQREAADERKYGSIRLLRDLLPALDNLGRAVEAAEKSHSVDELAQGVQMVLTQLEGVLGNHSVTPIAAVGEPFDPNLHDALSQVPTDEHPPMTVLQDVERGYKLHDRVIRPSKVIVSMAPPADATENQ